jgi:hypothetical protein
MVTRRESIVDIRVEDTAWGCMAGRYRSRRSMAGTARLEGIAKDEERRCRYAEVMM